MKLAIVGATGLVGKVVLQLLEERRFPVTSLIPVASKKSAGKKVLFRGSEIEVSDLDAALAMRPKIAIFSSPLLSQAAEAMRDLGINVAGVET